MAFQGYFPAMKPAAPTTGLLNSGGVTVVHHSPGDETWVNGPQDVESLTCAFDLLVSDYCSSGPDTFYQEASGDRVITTYPFGIVTAYTCTGQGLSMDERKSRVMQMAEVATGRALESELSDASIRLAADHFDTQYLTSHDAVDVSVNSTKAPASAALAAIEWALSQSGTGAGVIHMSVDIASRLSWLLKERDGKFYTMIGTPVVIGPGYSGAGPAGSAPVATVPYPAWSAVSAYRSTAWIYGTGPVTVHLGEVQYIGERLNTTDNEITVMAGRPAAVYWDGCSHFAAEVDLQTADL